jgi:hypothetical protein
MTGNYMKFENKSIEGFNHGSHKAYNSLEECKLACNSNPICLSFEIWQGRSMLMCTTGIITYEMAYSADPILIQNHSVVDLYSKTCS